LTQKPRKNILLSAENSLENIPVEPNDKGLLTSWKEISDHLDVDERTCRRWELGLRLPVHRMEGTSRSRVYAYRDELDAWRKLKLNGSLPAPDSSVAESKVHRAKIKQTYRWFVPIATAIVALAIFLAHSRTGPPADFRIKGSTLVILDQKGRELWGFDTKLENLLPETQYRERFQLKKPSNTEAPLFPFLVIKDINHDGKIEVLFCAKTIGEKGEPGLYCFTSKGKELWHYRAGRELQFGDRVYSPDYRTFGLEPYDVNADGFLEIFVIMAHQPHSPSELSLLDCQGKILGQFVNWGSISDIAHIDVDADRKEEVVVAGMNDEYGKGFMAVFDSTRISGSSPQSEKYACKNCSPGSERYYLIFPRTDVDKILSPDKVSIEAIHLLQNGRIELVAGTSHLYFELDYGLRLQDVKGSDIFRSLHRELVAAGKIKSELNDEYYQNLKRGALYWTGKEWTSTPTLNQNGQK
jgi:hypothetical protein